MNPDPKTQESLSFLGSHAVGVLATLSPAGEPHARTVYYVSNSALEVFFLTLSGTRKVEDINDNHRAAFVVSDEVVPKTLQIEGIISELTDTAEIDTVVKKLMDIFTSKGEHFAPLAHLDSGRVLFYKLSPEWVRWGDFTKSEGTDEAFTDIHP